MKIFLFAFFCFLTINLSAQEVVFERLSIDFGEISIQNTNISYDFEFSISGEDSVAIESVSASCGCIIPEWNRSYLFNEEKGKVGIVYNALNRPGAFSKELLVNFTNNETYHLTIKGEVVPEMSIEQRLQYQAGEIRYDKRRINLNSISTNSENFFKIELFNTSEKAIFLDSSSLKIWDFIQLIVSSNEIPPNSSLLINGIFTAPDRVGYHEYGIQLTTTDTVDNLLDIDLVANVFKSSEEEQSTESAKAVDPKALAPKVLFDKQVINFGKVQAGEILEVEFQISNRGDATLEIFKVTGNCSCIKIAKYDSEIKAGESAILKAEFQTNDLIGVQQKTIHVYSNSANGRLQPLMLKVNVHEK